MRPKLLKSFIVVLTFWFLLTTLWWTLASPEQNHQALEAMQKLMPFINFNVPAEASILSSWRTQLTVLAYWTAPIILATVLMGGAGLAGVWAFAMRQRDERVAREAGSGAYRGVTVTRGYMPEPLQLPMDRIELGSDEGSGLNKLSKEERSVLEEILGTISAAPSAYAGEGVSVDLLTHTLNLASRALKHPRQPGLASLAAAGHELAKITSYTNVDGNWVVSKKFDREAGRLLNSMPSWWTLPELGRNAVLMAVKFHSNAKVIPDLNNDPQIYRLAREILEATDIAQAAALTEEKKKTLEKVELSDIIFDTFLEALPQLSFQTRGLPKGVKAVAWKIKNRVFMLDNILRELLMAKLPAEVRGALAPNPKAKTRLQPFTLELLKALEQRGWLIRTHESTTLDVKEALWNVQAGTLTFKGAILIEVPPEYLSQLPKDDSPYDVAIVGTLFTPSSSSSTSAAATTAAGMVAGMPISKDDLLGSVLRGPAPSGATPDKQAS